MLVILGDQLSIAYQSAQLAQGIFSPDSVSVGDLFIGAIIPGLMLVGLYITYQIIIAIARPESSPAIPRDPDDPVGIELLIKVLKVLVPPIALIIAVLGSILKGIATPSEAAAVGAIGALFLAGHKQDKANPWPVIAATCALMIMLSLSWLMDLRITRTNLSPAEWTAIWLSIGLSAVLVYGIIISLQRVFRSGILTDVVRTSTQVTSMVFVILIGATLFSLVFRELGGDEKIHNFLMNMPGGPMGAMATVMLVMFVLGFFLDFLEIVFVVVPLVAPVLLQMEGINPVWLGIMMAVNLQTSFLTPPFGFALFYLRGVAPPSITTMQIYKGVIPFIIIQLIALGLLAAFPALATWLPAAA